MSSLWNYLKTRRGLTTFVVLTILMSLGSWAIAQRGGRWSREVRPYVDRNGVPNWENNSRFKSDVFTFVRIRYGSRGDYRGGKWATDYPDSDLNFSYRLHEVTSMPVDPNGVILDLTDDRLFDYPWVYCIEPGLMWLQEDEVLALRKYLLNGGFMMVDDFWGEYEYENFYENLKRVFPDREPIELPIEHEIFHCVYDLQVKPQVPSIHAWASGRIHEHGGTEAFYKGVFDDEGRMMMIICHNTDLGDGWEREGEDPTYFKEFAEKWSYPMGINIVTYAMTH